MVNKLRDRLFFWQTAKITEESSMKLASNKELQEYLCRLTAELECYGAHVLSRATKAASAHAWDMSTEFLGHARQALRRVRDEESMLNDKQRADLLAVLSQIEDAMNRRR